MKILQPALKFKVLGHGIATPPGPAFSNEDILRRHPQTSRQASAVHRSIARNIAREYGVDSRYLCSLPVAGMDHSPITSETLARQAVAQASAACPGRALDALVHGTTTSSRYTGSQATAIACGLGCGVAAFEIKAGCSTSLAALHCAMALLGAGHANAMVVCAETMSKVMHPDIAETWFGLADGAACVWLEKAEADADFEVEAMLFGTDGQYADLFTSPSPLPPHPATNRAGGYALTGRPADMKPLAQRYYRSMLEAYAATGADLHDIRWLIPHQASRALISEVCAGLAIVPEILWTADEYGNMGGASVLFSLAKNLQANRFLPGERIMLISVGGGLSYAMQVWRRL